MAQAHQKKYHAGGDQPMQNGMGQSLAVMASGEAPSPPSRSLRSHDDVLAELGHAGDRAAVDHRVLDLALVDAALDLEVALVAPVLVPAVGHEPVRHAALGAPAHDLDRVAAEHRLEELR